MARNLILATLPISEPEDDGYLYMHCDSSPFPERGFLEIRRCAPAIFENRLKRALKAQQLTNCLTAEQTEFIWAVVLQRALLDMDRIPIAQPPPKSLTWGDELLLVWHRRRSVYRGFPALHEVVNAGTRIGGMSLFEGLCTQHILSNSSPVPVELPADTEEAYTGFWIGDTAVSAGRFYPASAR